MGRSAHSSAHLRLAGIVSGLVLLAACGGGGGGGGNVISTPAPQPTPTPTPTPAPTPPSTFDTAEYRRSDGPDYHNAVNAWQRGIAGRGSTIAIVDTGIDTDSPEFAGRIDPRSAGVAGNGTVEQEDDHGTNVALVAAAARDDTGVVGMAFDANILAIRADKPGSCATEDPEGPSKGCVFRDTDIAEGVDLAVGTGATVINLSLGGGGIGSGLRNAIRRASAAGVVVIVAAGNDGDTTDDLEIDPNQPNPFASAILSAGGNNVIIAGSVDENGVISAFSNKAGSRANAYLTARGERVCCVYDDGENFITVENARRVVTLFSGTSFAAPQISGAVALLKQAFPNLSGAEMVEILLDSARDAGVSGPDAIYGRGILDIANAFAPRGTTTLAGSEEGLAIGDDAGVGSGAMGDAFSRAPVEAVLLDKYDRAYGIDLGQRFRGASVRPRLAEAVGTHGRYLSAGNGDLSLAFTIEEGERAGGLRWAGQLRLQRDDAETAHVLAARAALRLDPDTKLAFGLSQGADGLVAQLQGQDRPAFLVAHAANGDAGFAQGSETAVALRRQVGKWGITLGAQNGEAWLGNYRRAVDLQNQERERYATRNFSISGDRRIGPVDAIFGVTWLQEDRTVLGAYLHDAFGATGADSLFLDASASYSFAPRWLLSGAFRQGVTRARNSGLIADGSDFTSRAWSLDVSRQDALKQGDSFGFRLSSPLRVTGGGINLDLPVGYDYATEMPAYGIRHLSLAPQGSEMMGELAWRGPLWTGSVMASLYYRQDPGHYDNLPDDKGVAVKWSKRF